MNKKGFTLAELLGVLIIIGVLALLILPTIDNSIEESKDKMYKTQIHNIEEAATNWGARNMMLLPEYENEYIIVYLWQLKVGGFIDDDVRDPRNDKLFPNDMEIKITRKNNKYVYEVVDGSGTEGNTDIPDLDKPIITLIGDSIIMIHINSGYEELGAIAVSGDGKDLTDFIVISSDVDTAKEGTYYVKYNVTYDGMDAEEVVRIVHVMDKNPAIDLLPNGTHGYSKAVTVNVIATPIEGNTITSLTYKINNGNSENIVDNKIVLEENGVYTIEVTAVDNEGHITIVTSNPYYIDVSEPTIVFEEGDSGIELKVSEVEAFDLKSGVTVTDNNDTISIDDVTVSGTLDETLGEHTITYTVTDEAGNTTTKNRTITVVLNNAVARIGSITYATLRDAIDAVTTTNPTTIVMLKDVTLTEQETISETQNITLDLDGHTITNNNDATMFSIEGSFTLDSKNEGNIIHKSENYVMFKNLGNLTINNCTLSAPDTTLIRNNGGTVVTNGGNYSGNYILWNTISDGVITINNGNFEGQNIIDNDSGIATINGGTLIANEYNTIENGDEMTINGGIIKSISVEDSDGYYWDLIYNRGELVIWDGQFETSTTSFFYNTSSGTITIEDGTYTNGGDYYFMWNNSNNAVTINNGEFAGNLYMENAYSSSSNLNGSLLINGGKFNHTSVENMIVNYDSGNVQIQNATIESVNNDSTTYPLIINDDSGTITMGSGNNITVGNRTVLTNASTGNLVVNGGSYTCSTTAYYCTTNTYKGTFIVNDGIFENISTIFYNRREGKFQINGGNHTLPTNYAIINGGTGYDSYKGTIEITGGTYNLNNGSLVHNRVNGNTNISDVVINADSSANVLIANNYGSNYKTYAGNMVVNNTSVTTPNNRIFINGANGTLTINGGTYSSINNNVIRNDTNGIVNVNNSTIYGRINNGNSTDNDATGSIKINGGKIESSVSYAIRNYENGTVEITGAHIKSTAPVDEETRSWTAMIGNGIDDGSSGTVIVHSGTFESPTTALFSNRHDASIIIEDGTFTMNLEKDLDFDMPMSMSYENSLLNIKGGNFITNSRILLQMRSEESAGKVATDATTITIGEETAAISTISPKLISSGFTIYSDIGNVKFYNGSIVGTTPITNTANVTYRSGATYTTGTETINGLSLNSVYYK